MNLKLRKTILGAVLLFSALCARSATVNVDGFTYTTNTTKKTAELTKGPTSGDIVIPATISDGTTEYIVTSVKSKAFQKTAITSVTFPTTVTKLGSNAFEGCASLSKVVFAEGLTDTGSYSFKNCTSLAEINLPASLKTISSYAFDGCVLLEQVVIPDNVNMVMSFPFQNCTKLRSITVGAKLTSFTAESACKNCPLEEILVSAANKKLASVDGVLYDKNVTTLNSYPFYKKDETFTVPATVTRLKSEFTGVKFLKTFVCNDKLSAIPNMSFQDCPELTTVKVGKAVSQFGNRCFAGSPKFTTLEIDAANPYIKYVDGAVVTADDTELFTFIDFNATSYNAPEGLKIVNAHAFSENAKIKSVTLPATVDSIDVNAFYRCTALTEMVIPAGVRHINESTFYNCKGLSSVSLPENLLTVGESAFYNCYNLETIDIPESVDSIAGYAFYGIGATAIKLGDKVRTVGEYAFADCEYLADITIGAAVDTIAPHAFYNDYAWDEVTTTVGINATTPPSIPGETANLPFNPGIKIFVPKASLEAYKAIETYSANYVLDVQADLSKADVTLDQAGTLSQKVTEINGITDITIRGEINGSDFEYLNTMPMVANVDLSGVSIVAGGTEIVTVPGVLPKKAVVNLTKLETIKLPENLKEIGDSALYPKVQTPLDTRLKDFVIPASVTKIGSGAFAYRGGLTSVVLPDGLTYLGMAAFEGCEGLEHIEVPAAIDTLRESTFSMCSGLKDIKFNEGLKVIEERAFYACKAMTGIVLPSSVDSIGTFAFCSLPNLTGVSLNDGLKYLNNYAFAWCTSLEEVVFPESLELLGASCFSGCTNLRKADIPSGILEIRQSAFSLCPAIEKVAIPRSLNKKLGDGAFDRATSLKYAIVGFDHDIADKDYIAGPQNSDPVTKITAGSNVFAGCESLEAIYIGSSYKFLGYNFAANTPNLKAIYVSSQTPPDMFDGEPAFNDYSATLYVPKASILTYVNNRHWKNFRDIRPLESELSGIEDVFDNADANDVTVDGGTIRFADPDARVSVTNLSGQLLYSGYGGEVEVDPGLYIITVNSNPYKVVVK